MPGLKLESVFDLPFSIGNSRVELYVEKKTQRAEGEHIKTYRGRSFWTMTDRERGCKSFGTVDREK